jgi:hypothetical protein
MEKDHDYYYTIIHRYYNRFHRRKNNNDYKKPSPPTKENVNILRVYSRNTIFSSNENIVKEMLIIHYQIMNNGHNNDIFHLSISVDNYKDISPV